MFHDRIRKIIQQEIQEQLREVREGVEALTSSSCDNVLTKVGDLGIIISDYQASLGEYNAAVKEAELCERPNCNFMSTV